MSVYFSKSNYKYDFKHKGERYTKRGFKTKKEAEQSEQLKKEEIGANDNEPLIEIIPNRIRIKTSEAIALFRENIVKELKAEPPIEVPKFIVSKGKEKPVSMVVQISDSQIGHKTKSFSFDIFHTRMQRLNQRIHIIADIISRIHPIKQVLLCFNGDLIQNERLKEMVDLSELQGTVWQQIKEARKAFAPFIVSMKGIAPQVKCICTCGNHGSVSKMASDDSNWDGVIYEFLKLQLEQQTGIEFLIPDTFYYYFEVDGWRFLQVHGDQIKSWGGIPYYGISKKALEYFSSIGDFDYMLMSHFHRTADIPVNCIQIFINGTFASDDMYALKRYGARGMPMQRCFFLHPKNGAIWKNELYLDETGRFEKDKPVII